MRIDIHSSFVLSFYLSPHYTLNNPFSILVVEFQEDGIELASLIKATHMYRRAKLRNIVTDYVPPTDEEKECFRKAHLK